MTYVLGNQGPYIMSQILKRFCFPNNKKKKIIRNYSVSSEDFTWKNRREHQILTDNYALNTSQAENRTWYFKYNSGSTYKTGCFVIGQKLQIKKKQKKPEDFLQTKKKKKLVVI